MCPGVGHGQDVLLILCPTGGNGFNSKIIPKNCVCGLQTQKFTALSLSQGLTVQREAARPSGLFPEHVGTPGTPAALGSAEGVR